MPSPQPVSPDPGGNPATPARTPTPFRTFLLWLWADIKRFPLLWAGMLALVIPTMLVVARESWGTEQGAHGPIVLATGLWLLARAVPEIMPYARPSRAFWPTLLLIVMLAGYFAARVTSLIEVEGFVLYGVLLAVLLSAIGLQAMTRMWFPLFYMLFLFPPPQSLVDAATQPLKLWISKASVGILSVFGYPIGYSGVSIYIGQFEVLVAAACAGLNSLISLTAIGLFYVYIRYEAHWRYALVLMLFVVPVAVAANLVRVIILILITYYFGEAAAQGFIHDFAGITMFVAAVLAIFTVDALLTPLRHRLG